MFDYSIYENGLKCRPDSESNLYVLNQFLSRDIEMNEFQAKFIFLDNRQQGYSTLTTLRAIAHILKSKEKEFTIYLKELTPRGVRDYDNFLQFLFHNEFDSVGQQRYKMIYVKSFIQYLDEKFPEIEVQLFANDRLVLKKGNI